MLRGYWWICKGSQAGSQANLHMIFTSDNDHWRNFPYALSMVIMSLARLNSMEVTGMLYLPL